MPASGCPLQFVEDSRQARQHDGGPPLPPQQGTVSLEPVAARAPCPEACGSPQGTSDTA